MTVPNKNRNPGTVRRLRVAPRLLCASFLVCSALAPHGVGAQVKKGALETLPLTPERLLVIGFMGGRIKADNMVHQEAVIAQNLQKRNPGGVTVLTFANHDGMLALNAVINFVDTDGDHVMSPDERRVARVIIYGHSWGGSETVNLARTLDRMGVPVLLTIQVDSVQKFGENDHLIPSNVREAMNFYQNEGMLSGRTAIRASDPQKTVILGNQQLSYRTAPVNCDKFPWFARTFMKSHIEIENDPYVWRRVEAMIQQEVDGGTATD